MERYFRIDVAGDIHPITSEIFKAATASGWGVVAVIERRATFRTIIIAPDGDGFKRVPRLSEPDDGLKQELLF